MGLHAVISDALGDGDSDGAFPVELVALRPAERGRHVNLPPHQRQRKPAPGHDFLLRDGMADDGRDTDQGRSGSLRMEPRGLLRNCRNIHFRCRGGSGCHAAAGTVPPSRCADHYPIIGNGVGMVPWHSRVGHYQHEPLADGDRPLGPHGKEAGCLPNSNSLGWWVDVLGTVHSRVVDPVPAHRCGVRLLGSAGNGPLPLRWGAVADERSRGTGDDRERSVQ